MPRGATNTTRRLLLIHPRFRQRESRSMTKYVSGLYKHGPTTEESPQNQYTNLQRRERDTLVAVAISAGRSASSTDGEIMGVLEDLTESRVHFDPLLSSLDRLVNRGLVRRRTEGRSATAYTLTGDGEDELVGQLERLDRATDAIDAAAALGGGER